MIFSLLLYSCALSGADCRVSQVNVERMSLSTCLMASQIEAARYISEHPNRKVVGLRCSDRPQKFLHANEA
jgi:hypothetical protein